VFTARYELMRYIKQITFRLLKVKLHVSIVLKSGSLNFLEPSGSVKACNGIALPLPLYFVSAERLSERTVSFNNNCLMESCVRLYILYCYIFIFIYLFYVFVFLLLCYYCYVFSVLCHFVVLCTVCV
jgi:hypothetical protein